MIRGIPMILGDGKEYVIPPLTLGALEDYGDDLNNVGGLDKQSIKTTIDVALSALKRNYPDVTRDQVRELIDLQNMEPVFQACMDVSGLLRKELEATQAEAEAKLGEAQGEAPTASA